MRLRRGNRSWAVKTKDGALLRTINPNIPDTADPALPMQTVCSWEARMSDQGQSAIFRQVPSALGWRGPAQQSSL